MPEDTFQTLLSARFSDAPDSPASATAPLDRMTARGSCRAFEARELPDRLIETLCAVALSAPTKSDLQQRDIIVLKSAQTRAALAQLVAEQTWVAEAPMLLVFCGNNRRQRLLQSWHGIPFANDHIDCVVNATADAAIALGAFVTAAEACGLGCCPISAVRNQADAVSALLELPPHVFPFAGLALGYPRTAPVISKRLPLRVTCHTDHYRETDLRAAVDAYDTDRAATHPYVRQRLPDLYGEADHYGWSLDKARQYSVPERADFGQYLRRQGFTLD